MLNQHDLKIDPAGQVLNHQIIKRKKWLQKLDNDHVLHQLLHSCLSDCPKDRPNMKIIRTKLQELVLQNGIYFDMIGLMKENEEKQEKIADLEACNAETNEDLEKQRKKAAEDTECIENLRKLNETKEKKMRKLKDDKDFFEEQAQYWINVSNYNI